MKRSTLAILALAVCAAPAPSAFAYLDPASGSMFLQLVLGGVAGIALAVKLYWHKLLGLFGVKRHHDADDAGE